MSCLVMEVTVQAQDVLVPQVGLDFHLSSQLVLYAGLAQLGLEQHLHTPYLHEVIDRSCGC